MGKKRWSMKDLKDKGIFVNQSGVGKVLAPAKKKEITDQDIQKAIQNVRSRNKG